MLSYYRPFSPPYYTYWVPWLRYDLRPHLSWSYYECYRILKVSPLYYDRNMITIQVRFFATYCTLGVYYNMLQLCTCYALSLRGQRLIRWQKVEQLKPPHPPTSYGPEWEGTGSLTHLRFLAILLIAHAQKINYRIYSKLNSVAFIYFIFRQLEGAVFIRGRCLFEGNV